MLDRQGLEGLGRLGTGRLDALEKYSGAACYMILDVHELSNSYEDAAELRLTLLDDL